MKTKRLTIILIAIVSIFMIAACGDSTPPKQTPAKLRPKAMPNFKHEEHQKWECGECHHIEANENEAKPINDAQMLKDGKVETKCTACHDKVKEAFHGNCVEECHKKYQKTKKELSACKKCHKKSSGKNNRRKRNGRGG